MKPWKQPVMATLMHQDVSILAPFILKSSYGGDSQGFSTKLFCPSLPPFCASNALGVGVEFLLARV